MNYDQEYYNYHVQPLGFSEKAMNEAEGKFRPAFYQIKTEDIGVGRISVAWIPDSDRAEYEFLNWIRPLVITQSNTTNKVKTNNTQCPSESYFEQSELISEDDHCELDEIVVTAPPYDPGGGLDPDPDWNWPNDPYDPGAGGGGGPNNDNPECNPPDYCEEPEDDFCEINPTADVCADPCEGENPPKYCECEDTGNSVLDNITVQKVLDDLWKKQLESNKEQGGFVYMNGIGMYQFYELIEPRVTKRKRDKLEFKIPSGLPTGSIYIHTHPPHTPETKYGRVRQYEHYASDDDKKAILQMSQVVEYGVIIDPEYRILIDAEGNELTKATRCGY